MPAESHDLDPGILEDHKWLIAESNYQVILAHQYMQLLLSILNLKANTMHYFKALSRRNLTAALVTYSDPLPRLYQ